MTTVRGYEWGESNPRHEVQKRTYRDCTGCGKRTWSPDGVCSKCSGITEYRRRLHIHGSSWQKDHKERARKIWRELYNTNKSYQEIGHMFGVTLTTVGAIRKGNTHRDITGGYVLRPYEREKPRPRRNFSNIVIKIHDQLINTTKTQRTIAKELNISFSYVSAVRCGRTGTAITGGYVFRPYERES